MSAPGITSRKVVITNQMAAGMNEVNRGFTFLGKCIIIYIQHLTRKAYVVYTFPITYMAVTVGVLLPPTFSSVMAKASA